MKSKYLLLLAMSLAFCALGCSCSKEQPQGSVSGDSSSVETETEATEKKDAPVITVNQSEVILCVGDKFTLSASAENIEEPAFVWTVDGDCALDVVSVTQNGNDAVIQALKEGETKLIASVEYDGHTYFRSVSVTVKKNIDVVFVLGNVGFNDDGYAVRLSTISTDNGDEISIEPQVTAYKNNAIVQTGNFTWESQNTDVVKVDGRKFLSVGAGNTTVVGSCEIDGESYFVTVAVEVYRPTIALNESFTVEVENLQTLSYSSDQLRGFAEEVLYNGAPVGTFDMQSKSVTLDYAKLPKASALMGEDLTFTLETSLASYAIQVDLYTKMISSAEELDGIAKLSKKACAENPALWDGYFVLDEDIAYNGLFASKIADLDSLWLAVEGVWSNGGLYGFKGVIDGKGHKIEGISIDNGKNLGGFIGVLHIDGVVKNISFTKASVAANSSLVCGAGGGSVENIYVEYASLGRGEQWYEGDGSINTHCATFFGFKEPTVTANVSNCVVDVSRATIYEDTSIKLAGSEYATMKNVFVIGGNEALRAQSNATLAFSTVVDFVQSTNAQSRYKKFDSEFWSLLSGVPVSKTVYEEIYDNDVRFTKKVEYLVSGTEYKLPVDNAYAIVTSDSPYVSIQSGVAMISQDAPEGEEVCFTVTSIYDSLKTDTFTCQLAPAMWTNYKDLTGATQEAFYDITENEMYLADLGKEYPALKDCQYFINTDYTAATYAKDGAIGEVYAIAKEAIYKIKYKSVTKVIDSADDLHHVRRDYTVLSYGAPSYDGLLTGTFVMINDIDCKDLTLKDTGGYWENSRGFRGTFDGRGYTISNLTVSANGLFGNLTYATVKNVKFTNVQMQAADQGVYVALLARSSFNSTVESVEMQFASYITAEDGADIYHHSGLMFYETTYDSTFKNLKIDISALSGVKFLTERVYEDYDSANQTVKNPPYQSQQKSTYESVTVLVKDVNDVPAFAYKNTAKGTVPVEYPRGFVFEDTAGNVKY